MEKNEKGEGAVREQTCCFTGHRAIADEDYAAVTKALDRTVTELVKSGIVYFGVGGARGFDMLAAGAVLKWRRTFPHIRLIVVEPHADHSAQWTAEERMLYTDIRRRADKVVTLQSHYTADCMLRRNRHLVDNSRVCVCYLTHYGTGTGYTVQYAQKQGLIVRHLVSTDAPLTGDNDMV